MVQITKEQLSAAMYFASKYRWLLQRIPPEYRPLYNLPTDEEYAAELAYVDSLREQLRDLYERGFGV